MRQPLAKLSGFSNISRFCLILLTALLFSCSDDDDHDAGPESASFTLPETYCSTFTIYNGLRAGLISGDVLTSDSALANSEIDTSILTTVGQASWYDSAGTQTGTLYVANDGADFNGRALLAVNRSAQTRLVSIMLPEQSGGCFIGVSTATAKAANLKFGDFVNFESAHVRPLAITTSGDRLLAVNTPDAHLEIYAIENDALTHRYSVPVGLEPVAVAIRNDAEAWVVNHLSDSVSIVSLTGVPRVIRTLQLGDEPRDIVFAGENQSKAFITAARRGQNHPSFSESELITPGIGRADVWVFDATSEASTPETIVTLFADTPRALTVSSDGNTVYAAAFSSGNQTTVLPPTIIQNDKPAPFTNLEGETQPRTGLIIKYDSGKWVDESGKDWSDQVKFALPDYDVFAINANTATPAVTQRISGVGTTLFNMAINPVTGELYVSNTEALNEVRFEGTEANFSSVRGHIAENRISIINNGSVSIRHLNKHIDFDATVDSPISGTEKARSLSTPMQLWVTNDGSRLYLLAFGSNKLAWFDTGKLADDSFVPDSNKQLIIPGGGPSGLVANSDGSRLFVMSRYNNSISIVDTNNHTILGSTELFNPEPDAISAGRPFLYDATLSSDNGANSCGSCHLFGDMDSLAWDLGDPGGEVRDDPNTYIKGTEIIPGAEKIFHPLKGPMTTQTLRGLKGHGTQHWRGDRTGQNRVEVNGELESIAAAAFKEFNPAFVGLVGRGEPLSEADMQAFTDFALSIVPPPNPVRSLDNTLTTSQERGRRIYYEEKTDGRFFSCHDCHVLSPTQGFFGTNGESTKEGGRVTQNFKVPHERNLYQKVGMFSQSLSPAQLGSDQIRGFGFLHDGSVDTLDTFFHSAVFNFENQQGRDDMVAFMFSLDSNLAPVVGQQLTLTQTNKTASSATSRLALLEARASIVGIREECDLIARGVIESEQRSYLFNADGSYTPDRTAESDLSSQQLLDLLNSADDALSFTCVPPGSGIRMGLDRDRDGARNRDS